MPAHGITCEDLESGNDDLEILAQPAKRRRITGKSRPTLAVSGAMQEHEEPERRTETRAKTRTWTRKMTTGTERADGTRKRQSPLRSKRSTLP